MSATPIASAGALRIGRVDFVSPDEIKVSLDVEAPEDIALNTGIPRAFPRLNGYVLVNTSDGYMVGQIQWITVQPSQFPKRRGMQDFGLVDLPYPVRKLSLNPLGTLQQASGSESENSYNFTRGMGSYPAVGDEVLLPTQRQLRAIVESGVNRRVRIGTSPLAANAEVKIDPDRLFGRHLAVLGNTGSGKSCSVAGLIRWSLDAAQRERKGEENPNARFIILDPNGEYSHTFDDIQGVRQFAVGAGDGANQLRVPLWLWNSAEWTAFTQATARTQRPTLVQALRTVKDGSVDEDTSSQREMRRYLRTIVSLIQIAKNSGTPWAGFPKAKGFLEMIEKWKDGFAVQKQDYFSKDENAVLAVLSCYVNEKLLKPRSSNHPNVNFTKKEIDDLLVFAKLAYGEFGGSDSETLPIDADLPLPFTGDQLLRSVEANAELMGVSDYVETMLMRIRALLSGARLRQIAGSDGKTSEESLSGWLASYIGDDGSSAGPVSVIDLSLVPAEIVHLVTAVIARVTLEALQRYRRLNGGKTLPTVLVMEEAHTFVRRYRDDPDNQSVAAVCCKVFEKIAREGRKFGLGMVLSSQRPSELSSTVLSQCNSFLLHRISNDRDQELVNRLLPDSLSGLLHDLPSLPSRQAVLLGWASELPVLVEIDEIPEKYRPRSDDPDYWNVWLGKEERNVDWKSIADDWQQNDGGSILDNGGQTGPQRGEE